MKAPLLSIPARIAISALVLWGCAAIPPSPALTPGELAVPAARVQMVVHRGGTEHAPENTLAAAERCVEWGVEYIEVDVRTSADGVLYVFHDARLERTTDGRGAFASAGSAYIDGLDAGGWFAPRFAGEPVPRLRNALLHIKGQAGVYCDVKEADPEAVHRVLVETGMATNAIVGFRDEKLARTFRKLGSGAAIKVKARSLQDLERAVSFYDAGVVEIKLGDMTPQLVDFCRQHRLRMMIPVWDKDPARYRAAMSWGADLINVEHPDAFLRTRAAVVN